MGKGYSKDIKRLLDEEIVQTILESQNHSKTISVSLDSTVELCLEVNTISFNTSFDKN